MVTYLIIYLTVQSLQFSVTGSKMGEDILVTLKSNYFESKCKQMK